MFSSLYFIAKSALEAYPADGTKRENWLFVTAAQTILLVDQIKWTLGVETAIYEIMGGKNRGALGDFEKFSNDQLQNMIALVRGELNKQQRNMLGALITLDVHAKEVTSRLIRERCDDINAFGW